MHPIPDLCQSLRRRHRHRIRPNQSRCAPAQSPPQNLDPKETRIRVRGCEQGKRHTTQDREKLDRTSTSVHDGRAHSGLWRQLSGAHWLYCSVTPRMLKCVSYTSRTIFEYNLTSQSRVVWLYKSHIHSLAADGSPNKVDVPACMADGSGSPCRGTVPGSDDHLVGTRAWVWEKRRATRVKEYGAPQISRTRIFCLSSACRWSLFVLFLGSVYVLRNCCCLNVRSLSLVRGNSWLRISLGNSSLSSPSHQENGDRD
ncbi:hypothetical protein M011DRAFT_48680 [Sporormia fimetaria CBS 119925]|uniref:Uncharacterized protein n=1 Tax=Sporormia fimetaria CBS 119925 TaxID=1340428 RepID=A0A6A6VCJ2_9PLEO|nr:hypothetical protein M011DRAFT_48680 [Sporormia fimetaria CBS 119925]